MPQTRISKDVWELAEQVSDRMGLNSPRLAIEAIVRVCASHYTAGSLNHSPLPAQQAELPIKSVPSVQAAPTAEPDASKALSSLMQSFS